MRKGIHRTIPQSPTITHDHLDGAEIVLVPLGGTSSKIVTLDKPDYDELQHLNLHRSWYWNATKTRTGGVVKCNWNQFHKGLLVSRLIMQPEANHCVFYRDGDALNLRRKNLWIGKGKALARERIPLMDAFRAAGERMEREAKYEGMTPVERTLAMADEVAELELSFPYDFRYAKE